MTGDRWRYGRLACLSLMVAAGAWWMGGAHAADDIRIGLVAPMTGPTAKFGQAEKNAVSLAVEEINAAGGIKAHGGAKLVLAFGDTRGDGDTGVTETERVITKEKAVAVVGAFQSGVSLPASAVAERYQVPWVNFSTADKMAERGFKYFFRPHANDSVKAKALVDGLAHAGKKSGGAIKNAVIMAENTDWGKSVSVRQKAGLEANGTKIEMLENYPFATPDVTSMIVKAKGFKPELVLIDAYLGDALLIARTMAEQDLKPVVFATGGGGVVQPDFLAGAGPLAEGVISAVAWDAGVGRSVPWIAEENAKHVARFGAPFTEDSACFYQNVYIIADALERVKGAITGPSLRDAIAATKITDPNHRAMIVPYPEISFAPSGENPHAQAFVVQWQQGKLVMVYPDKLTDPATKIVWPYPAQ
jgi:branched-chain amino acid transport system substrate-binding protein